MNGIPDLMALKGGETIFIEVKQKNGILSPLQIERKLELEEQGFKVFIWTDYEQNFNK